jgi:hypothetical protein
VLILGIITVLIGFSLIFFSLYTLYDEIKCKVDKEDKFLAFIGFFTDITVGFTGLFYLGILIVILGVTLLK